MSRHYSKRFTAYIVMVDGEQLDWYTSESAAENALSDAINENPDSKCWIEIDHDAFLED